MAELFKRGGAGDRPGGRLPEARPLALPLDGDLAHRQRRADPADRRLARPLPRRHRARRDRRLPRGMSLTGSLPQAFQADKVVVPVVEQLDAFNEEAEDDAAGAKLRRTPDHRPRRRRRRSASSAASPTPSTGPPTGSSRRPRSTSPRSSIPTASWATSSSGPPRSSPAGWACGSCSPRRTATTPTPTRLEAHGNLLGELSEPLAAFRKDLAAQGLADKVVVMVFSEFGRRVDENASGGHRPRRRLEPVPASARRSRAASSASTPASPSWARATWSTTPTSARSTPPSSTAGSAAPPRRPSARPSRPST